MVVLVRDYLIEHPEECKATFWSGTTGTRPNTRSPQQLAADKKLFDDRHVHGSAACVVAAISWEEIKIKRLLEMADKQSRVPLRKP